jgi:hypothetical protein
MPSMRFAVGVRHVDDTVCRQARHEKEQQADDEVQAERRQVARALAREEFVRQAAGLHEQVAQRAPQARVRVGDALEGLGGEMPHRVHVRFVTLAAGGTVLAGRAGRRNWRRPVRRVPAPRAH